MAAHMVADQEAKNTTGTRACTNLRRPAPTDPHPPARLYLLKVPQSSRLTPLAEEQVCETFPGLRGDCWVTSDYIVSWVALTVILTAWSRLRGRPRLRKCVDQIGCWAWLLLLLEVVVVVVVAVVDYLDCHLMKERPLCHGQHPYESGPKLCKEGR